MAGLLSNFFDDAGNRLSDVAKRGDGQGDAALARGDLMAGGAENGRGSEHVGDELNPDSQSAASSEPGSDFDMVMIPTWIAISQSR